MSKDKYSDIMHSKHYRESIRAVVQNMIFEGDPKELDAYRKLVRKNVSIFRRTYLTGYLFKLLKEDDKSLTRQSAGRGHRRERNVRQSRERTYSSRDSRYTRDSREGTRDSRDGARDSRDGTRDSRDGTRDSREGARDSREGARDSRDGTRDSREGERDSRYTRGGTRESARSSAPTTPHVIDGITSLHINCGRLHEVSESDMRTLIDEVSTPDVIAGIENIRIYDRYLFIYIDEKQAAALLESLNGLDRFERKIVVSYSKKYIR